METLPSLTSADYEMYCLCKEMILEYDNCGNVPDHNGPYAKISKIPNLEKKFISRLDSISSELKELIKNNEPLLNYSSGNEIEAKVRFIYCEYVHGYSKNNTFEGFK